MPLPEGVGTLAGGPELGRLLESVDRTAVNGHQLVTVIRARMRQISALQAELFADMTELAHCPPGGADAPVQRRQEPEEFASDEVAAALCWTRTRADAALHLAWRLTERLPGVWEALRSGRIDEPRARAIVEGTDHLDAAAASDVAERILVVAGSSTTGQIRARVRRLCAEADPDHAAAQYEQAVDRRRLVVDPTPEGTADLCGLDLPADRAAGIVARISELARKRRRRHDPRSIDQLRADIFLELLEGRHDDEPHRRATVDIRVDLPTLIHLDDRAAEIPGWGPVISDIARHAVDRQPDGEWRVTVVDPDTDTVLWNGITRRRPTTAQRRHIEARQPACTHPLCRMPATGCDIDHLVDYHRGGPTEVANLAPACRHHHTLKTRGGWTVHHPHPGHYLWTSPHGHTYRTGTDPP